MLLATASVPVSHTRKLAKQILFQFERFAIFIHVYVMEMDSGFCGPKIATRIEVEVFLFIILLQKYYSSYRKKGWKRVIEFGNVYVMWLYPFTNTWGENVSFIEKINAYIFFPVLTSILRLKLHFTKTQINNRLLLLYLFFFFTILYTFYVYFILFELSKKKINDICQKLLKI